MGKLLIGGIGLWLMVLLVLVACVPQAAPAPVATPVAVAPLSQAPAKEGWEVEWDKVMEAAKKEGSVVFSSTAGAEVRAPVASAFKGKYGLRVESVGARGGEISEKLKAERRAGLHLVDVYIGGPTTVLTDLKPAGVLDPLEPALILPEVKDPKVWWRGQLPWGDKDHYLISFTQYPSSTYAINTELVRAEELKSYRDLLNPKWKGKMVMNDPTLPGAGNTWFARVGYIIMSLDFLRELAKQEPVILRDQRLQVEWLAHGKYAIAIAPDTTPMAYFGKAGAPVSYVTPVEGLVLAAGHGNVSLVNRAPHPNAAKVFINWLLSREGQEVWSRATLNPSVRLDVSSEHVEPEKRREPGVKYYVQDEEFYLANPEQVKVAKEIFGHLLK